MSRLYAGFFASYSGLLVRRFRVLDIMWMSNALGMPFNPNTPIQVVIPTQFEGLSETDRQQLMNIPKILRDNAAALKRELGSAIEIIDSDPGDRPRWLIGPSQCNPVLTRSGWKPPDGPVLSLDRSKKVLITDAPTSAGVWETFSLLRSLAYFPGGIMPVRDCANIIEAIQRVIDEVGNSYPSFELRGLDWLSVCERHKELVLSAANPISAIQRWLSELNDGHTWVRPAIPQSELLYEVWIENGVAVLSSVPIDSAAWRAGVRPGFRLQDSTASEWYDRTAATPHSRPLIAGRRLLTGVAGAKRNMVAISPDGKSYEWEDQYPTNPWEPVLTWKTLPSGAGYMKIKAWLRSKDIEDRIDEALTALRGVPGLIVDMRGNPGGDIVLAEKFRSRFLREPQQVGSIRYSISHRVLSEYEPIMAEPAQINQRWNGPVRFLTDPLTYSSSEDALLGLQGLPHVEVIGERSGGGSGRMRSLRLLPGWKLTISTALTYDRNGRCVEGAGIPVDRLVRVDRRSPPPVDIVLAEADRSW